jgi:AraC-like DNA-binding protein
MRTRIWSTQDVPPTERTTLWRTSMHDSFGGLRTEFYGDAVFSGTLVTSRFGELPIARLDAGRHRVVRDARNRDTADPGDLKILAPFAGEAWVYQHNRKALARPGAWVVYDTAEPYAVENPHHVDHLVMMVPRRWLEDAKLNVQDFMAHSLGPHGISRMALESMRSAYFELSHMPPHLAHSAAQALGQLIRLSLLQLSGAHGTRGGPLALRERVQRYVAQHLGDPALSVSRIASDLGCSKRLLHAAFSDAEESLRDYITTQRIAACARTLADPQAAARSISEIASEHGVVNASHFSRAFRERMGVSPREHRERSRS